MKEFENKAKEILLYKYVDEFISFAKDSKRKEVKDIQPLLNQLLSDLLPVAFPTKDFKQLKLEESNTWTRRLSMLTLRT